MGRTKQRTDLLTPIFALRVQQWGLSRLSAKNVMKLTYMSDAAFWRVLRSDAATVDEVLDVGLAIIKYGEDHNLPGWKELEESL